MKKIISLFICISALLPMHKTTQAQFSLDAYVLYNNQHFQDTVYICEGDSIQAIALINNLYHSSNFNIPILDSFWLANSNCTISSLCSPTNFPASGLTCWFGSSANTRVLESTVINLENYPTTELFISWDMKYGANQNSSNCESPDEPSEGVHLMWKYADSSNWHQFSGIDSMPSGVYGNSSYHPGSGGYWTPVLGNAATGPYYTWNHYQSKLPIEAMGKRIKIKFFQDLISGNTFDHWGLDNIEIKTNSLYYVEWKVDNIPVSNNYSITSHFPAFGIHNYVFSAIDLNNGNIFIDTIVVIVKPKPTKPFITYMNDSLKAYYLNGIQWYYQNVPIQGAFQNFYIPANNGSYTAVYTNSFGCKSVHSDPIVVYNVGIDDLFEDKDCFISPNPVVNTFKIHSVKKLNKADICNVNGQIIKSLFIDNNTLFDVSDLSDGMYFLIIHTDNELFKMKFVKTKK